MAEDVAVLSLGQRLRHRSAGLDLWHAREKTEFFDEEKPLSQWIGVRENLQESPRFNGKIDGFL